MVSRSPTLSVAHAIACLLIFPMTASAAPTPSLQLNLSLRTGGSIDGLVVEHGDDGVVIVHDGTPYAFAWQALEPASAIMARRELLALSKRSKSADGLDAEDYFALGAFALSIDAHDRAINLFRAAQAQDPGLVIDINEALNEFRQRTRPQRSSKGRAPKTDSVAPEELIGNSTTGPSFASFLSEDPTTPVVREQVDGIYRTFGLKVREVMGKQVTLVETAHFLIWTDWQQRHHAMLGELAESMYESLCTQFGVEDGAEVFLAKCPIFCWKTKKQFVKFARHFDGHDGVNAIGYTRSIERNGHVHVVLLRQGKSRIDFDRFAATLVHEGTHAFLHRLHAPRLIPHWINEGVAEMMSERVLGDRSVAGEEAEMLARVHVRYDWSIGEVISSTGPIGVEQYGLVCSVVGYLHQRSETGLVALIRALKSGSTTEQALTDSYDGLTLDRLEADWRTWVQGNDPVLNAPVSEDARLPWRD